MSRTVDVPQSCGDKPAYPVPNGGIYGPGLQVEATVNLESVEESEYNHHFDKEGKFAPYWQFSFKIVPEEGPLYWVRKLCSFMPGSGSSAYEYLEVAGAPGEPYENGEGTGMRYDLDQAAPRELGGIELAEPYISPSNGKEYHGDILRVIGKE